VSSLKERGRPGRMPPPADRAGNSVSKLPEMTRNGPYVPSGQGSRDR